MSLVASRCLLGYRSEIIVESPESLALPVGNTISHRQFPRFSVHFSASSFFFLAFMLDSRHID